MFPIFSDVITGGPCYMREIGTKIRLAYNEFAFKKTKDTYKLGDRFLKNSQFSIAQTLIRR
jgi:hypothetical protein